MARRFKISLAEAAVLGYAVRYAPIPTGRVLWAFAAEYGPATGRFAGRTGTIALESGSAVRAVAMFARFGGAVGVGAVIGAGVGIGISRAGWGEKGQQDAIDVYSGDVSAMTWIETVSEGLLGLTPGHRQHGHGTTPGYRGHEGRQPRPW